MRGAAALIQTSRTEGGSYRRIQPRRGMRYLGDAQERQSDANATGKTPDNCLYQSAGDILRFTVVTLAACLAASNSAVGQWMGKQTGCYADSIAANPNRPTVANPADITQYGVLGLGDGWDPQWPRVGRQHASVAWLF